MKLVNKKTRKALRKGVRKVIKKHGPEFMAALAGGAMSRRVTEMLTGDDRTRSRASEEDKPAKKKNERRGKTEREAADRTV